MQDTSWADGLEFVGDDERLVGHVGVVPLRLLAQRGGLTAGVSAAMARRGFNPIYDRGQVLIDLALVQILGGETISDFQVLAHLAPVIGAVPSTSTVWRTLEQTGQLQLARINTAVVAFRRYWWGRLAARPEGFAWLRRPEGTGRPRLGAQEPRRHRPIVGATRPYHLPDAVAAFETQLSDDEIRALEESYTPRLPTGF